MPSIYGSLKFWSINHTLIYIDSELKVFKNLNYVSKSKAKCFAAIGNAVSVKITLVQRDSFFILFQFSISEI